MAKTRLRKFLACIAAAAALTAVLAGCGGSADKGGAGLALHLATSGDEGIQQPLVQIAEEAGYYKDYGLKLDRTKLGNNGALMYDALAAGKVNAAYQQMVPPLSYAARGDDVKLFAGLISGGMVAVTKAENAAELKDLKNWKGHSIGVVQMSTSELTTRWVLENEYGFQGDDVHYVMMEDYPSIAIGVEKGNVDIGFISSQYLPNAEKQGLALVDTLADIKPNYVCCRQSANGTYFSEHRDAYVAYLKGQIKAYKTYRESPDEVVRLLAKNTGEDEGFIRDYIYDEEKSAKREFCPDPNYNGSKATYDELLKQGYVQSDKTLDELYDISVYAQALKEVIAENPDDGFYDELVERFLRDNSEYPDFGTTYNKEYFGRA